MNTRIRTKMTKTDAILEHIIEIKSDTGGIKEHLKQLNGRVAKNQTTIEENRQDIVTNRINYAKLLVGIGVTWILLELALNIWL